MSGVEMEEIVVNKASVNNLKDITVNFPLDALTCVIGVSGCGKSSLVFDTLYAESQRSFLESMTGNMFGQKLMDKPKVGSIENLRPALNVSQNYYNFNPRSTVGTITDISYYLRTLFALICNYENQTDYTESTFSPNNPKSCCDRCNGIGREYVISLDKLVPDSEKKLSDGAIRYYKGKNTSLEYQKLEILCNEFNININSKFSDLSDAEKFFLLNSKKKYKGTLRYKTQKGKYRKKDIEIRGALIELEEKLLDISQPSTFKSIEKFLTLQNCSVCKGYKIKDSILNIRVCDKNVGEIEYCKLENILIWLNKVQNRYKKSNIYEYIFELIEQIRKRVEQLISIRLSYISLNRSIPTLSGGEIQRIRIATQLSCSLHGLIYILDEPCKGLHPKDIDFIILATKNLISKKNTVIAIEHNQQYIKVADNIIELGPKGGPEGGYVIYEGKNDFINKESTNFKDKIKFLNFFELIGINYHNIINQNVKLPIGAIVCITGVSGSGKSSLTHVIKETVTKKKCVNCSEMKGGSYFKHVELVDQKPIGQTPRSTIITYLEIYDKIRALFSNSENAEQLKLTKSDFSMNVGSGTCVECGGTGYQKIELSYLPDAYITCPKCNGKRFNDDVLSIMYRGLSIDQILNLSISQIIDVFYDVEIIFSKLKCMIDMGLGYLKLGQMSMNLSGGEAQRVKLAKTLGKKERNNCLYILDEPTSGLNFRDVTKLEKVLLNLQNSGNTIVVIAHNKDFVKKNADYLIDFGNEAGDKGGVIVSQGYVKDVFNDEKSSWYGTKDF